MENYHLNMTKRGEGMLYGNQYAGQIPRTNSQVQHIMVVVDGISPTFASQ